MLVLAVERRIHVLPDRLTDDWRAPNKGGAFDPNADTFLQPASFFGAQPTTGFVNETRYNPKLHYWLEFNENVSLAPSINLHGEQKRLDFRWRRSIS